METVSSERSVAVTLTEIPTITLVNASLEPAYTILLFTLAESGDLETVFNEYEKYTAKVLTKQ